MTMTTKPIILLLSGWAGSGKDAAALLLTDEMRFERLAFADALKRDVSQRTGLPVHLFHDRELKDMSCDGSSSPRSLLIEHALTVRKDDPDIYSRIICEQVKTEAIGTRIVISDWRYKREYEFLSKELRGYTILKGRIKRGLIKSSADVSEHDLDAEPMDFVIANNGSISDLRDAIRDAIRHHTGTVVHHDSYTS